MKKNVVVLSALVAGVSLMGCGEVSSSLSSVSSTTSVSSVSTTTSVSTTSSVSSVEEPQKTVVTIADWNLGAADADNLLRRRVAAFNESSTTIEIQPIVFPGGDYNGWLAQLAAAGELPDIMMANSVADYTTFGYTADLADFVEVDPDWPLIPEDLRNTVTYGEKVLGLPVGMYLLGYFANHDLINEWADLGDASAEDIFTAANFTYEEFIGAVEDVNDLTPTDGSGVVGLDNVGEMLSWLPSVLDESGKIGQYFWDGEKMAFLDDAVKETFVETKRLFDNDFVYEGALTTEQMDAALGFHDWAGELFFRNQLAFKWGGTWDTWFAGAIGDKFDYEFVGVPGDRVVGVGDYYVISPSTHVAASYEVARYLSFGTAGIAKALDIVYSNPTKGFSLPGLPLNQLFADVWLLNNPLNGVSELYNRVKAGEVRVIFEGNKWVPGFPTARWNYKTSIYAQISRPDAQEGATLSIGDFIWDASQGKISYTDHMTIALANLLNQIIIDATEAMLAE